MASVLRSQQLVRAQFARATPIGLRLVNSRWPWAPVVVILANSWRSECIENNVSFCRALKNGKQKKKERQERRIDTGARYFTKVKVQNNLMTIAVMPVYLEESNILSVWTIELLDHEMERRGTSRIIALFLNMINICQHYSIHDRVILLFTGDCFF